MRRRCAGREHERMAMPEKTAARTRPTVESKLVYRADIDQSGDWYVWQRLGASGWAALQRCRDRAEAIEIASMMNRTCERAG
ncbi:MAG: hypothetical protein EDM82_06765 [Cyanobacteria bacterium CYA]|nr:MAG: hypothetical protein EDM82_06765 [Cyanobacteria bacterium CYA]